MSLMKLIASSTGGKDLMFEEVIANSKEHRREKPVLAGLVSIFFSFSVMLEIT
jgi:hypothetical protein